MCICVDFLFSFLILIPYGWGMPLPPFIRRLEVYLPYPCMNISLFQFAMNSGADAVNNNQVARKAFRLHFGNRSQSYIGC